MKKHLLIAFILSTISNYSLSAESFVLAGMNPYISSTDECLPGFALPPALLEYLWKKKQEPEKVDSTKPPQEKALPPLQSMLQTKDIERTYKVIRHIDIDPAYLKTLEAEGNTLLLDELLDQDLTYNMYKSLDYVPGIEQMINSQIIMDLHRRPLTVVFNEKLYPIKREEGVSEKDYTAMIFQRLVRGIKNISKTPISDMDLLHETVHRTLYFSTQTFDKDSIDFIQIHLKKEYQLEAGNVFLNALDIAVRFEVLEEKITTVNSVLFQLINEHGRNYGFVRVERKASLPYNADVIPDEYFHVKFIPDIHADSIT